MLETLQQEILRDGFLMLRGFFSTDEADHAEPGQTPLIHQIVTEQPRLKRASLFNLALTEKTIGEILERKGFVGLAKQIGQRIMH
jgi:hypothetical protein